jgi:glucose/arabinose dehydrogenase
MTTSALLDMRIASYSQMAVDGGITDLQVGPDGYLSVLTNAGSIYRITPNSGSAAR